MKIYCWYCHKPVSNELPEDSIIRAISICPECIEHEKDKKIQRKAAEHRKAKITCSNGHVRIVYVGQSFYDACPVCGIETYEYDSRFNGE